MHYSFRDEETKLWKEGLPSRQPEHIVQPTGSWSAQIAHHLHNPSYTTLFPEDGEVGDLTNGCTALIMGNNYDPKTHFMFDHFHRREDFDPFSNYPQHIKSFHEAHTKRLRATVQAKVEVLYGSYVRNWAVRELAITSLKLWGCFEEVWIHFEWEMFGTHMEHKRIAKILVFAFHPQKMLSYQMRSRATAVEQDRLITVAYKLARVPVTEDYNQTMAWTSKQDFIQSAYSKTWNLLEKSRSQKDLVIIRDHINRHIPKPIGHTQGGTATVLSLGRLEEILNHVFDNGKRLGSKLFKQPIASIYIEDDAIIRDSLPPIMNEWLTSQRMTFFNGVDVQYPQDLLSAYREHCKVAEDIPPQGLKAMEMILSLMNMQQVRIRTRGLIAPKSNQAPWQYYSTFQEMSRRCDTCGVSIEPDGLPRFSIQNSGLYMARRIKCTSSTCQGANRKGIPADDTLWLRAFTKNKVVTQSMLVRPSNDCLGLPNVVECWCVFCKEHTRVSADQSKHKAIDANPQWTKGKRPKYITRPFYCSNCSPKTHRFVPVAENINFISPRDLLKFSESFSYMDEAAMIAHLGARPSTSFQPKKSAQRGHGEVGKSLSLEPAKLDKTRVRAKDRISAVNQGNPSIDSVFNELVVPDLSKPRIIEVKCDKCGQNCGADYAPKWHRDTGEYISKYRKGCPQKCTFSKVWLIPKDNSLAFIRMTTIASQKRSLNNHLTQVDGPVLKLGPFLTEDQLLRNSSIAREIGQAGMEDLWRI